MNEKTASLGAVDNFSDALAAAFISAMKTGDGRIRCIAAQALGRMRLRKAAGPLIESLNDPDLDVRCDAAAALGLIGDEDAVGPLAKALSDEDPQVILCALRSLAKIGGHAGAGAVMVTLADGRPFYYDLGGDLSGDYGWEIRQRAAYALGEMGDKRALEPLRALLGDEESGYMLGTVLSSIARIGGREALETMAGCLKDPDLQVRRMAARSFIDVNDREAIDSLVNALVDQDAVVKTYAIDAIANIGDRKDATLLVLMLRDEDAAVRMKAAAAIGRLCGIKALRHIHPMLNDKELEVRKKAAEILGDMLSAESAEALAGVAEDRDEDEGVCAEAVMSLVKIGRPAAAQTFTSIMTDKDRNGTLRVKAALALGRIKTSEGHKALLDTVVDIKEDEQVRRAALQAAGMYDETADIEALNLIIADGDEFVRRGVARMLRNFSDSCSEAMLLRLLDDGNDAVRKDAAVSLAYRGSDAGFEVLIRMQEKDGIESPVEFYGSLGRLKCLKAHDMLLNGLKSPSQAQSCAAVRAAGHSGDTAFLEALIDKLSDADQDVRREAVIALGALGDDRALEPLIGCIFDSERYASIRLYLASSIAKIDVKKAVESLLAVLADADKAEYRSLVIESLSEIYGAYQAAGGENG